MYKIDTDFQKVKKGETICYHIGHLIKDRSEKKRELKINKNGKEILKKANFTERAITIQKIADKIYAYACLGEFELKQERLGVDQYAYFAKKVK